ncbi:hypothetical protein BS78_09G101700 [Paspalum vaginatum]|nr:hypothetical protein BS78_09G101700 [Paspalum vaginatum]
MVEKQGTCITIQCHHACSILLIPILLSIHQPWMMHGVMDGWFFMCPSSPPSTNCLNTPPEQPASRLRFCLLRLFLSSLAHQYCINYCSLFRLRPIALLNLLPPEECSQRSFKREVQVQQSSSRTKQKQ